MKRTVFLIAAAGSVLTAFLFFQPVSNDGGRLVSPATTASPVASTSKQPVALTSTGVSAQNTTTNGTSAQPTPVSNSGVTKKITTNAPALKVKSPSISIPSSIKGGGDDEGDDGDYEDDDEDEGDDD
jgi:hypothetical protein